MGAAATGSFSVEHKESTRGSDPSGVALCRLAVGTSGSRCTYFHRDADERIAPDEYFAKVFGPAR